MPEDTVPPKAMYPTNSSYRLLLLLLMASPFVAWSQHADSTSIEHMIHFEVVHDTLHIERELPEKRNQLFIGMDFFNWNPLLTSGNLSLGPRLDYWRNNRWHLAVNASIPYSREPNGAPFRGYTEILDSKPKEYILQTNYQATFTYIFSQKPLLQRKMRFKLQPTEASKLPGHVTPPDDSSYVYLAHIDVPRTHYWGARFGIQQWQKPIQQELSLTYAEQDAILPRANLNGLYNSSSFSAASTAIRNTMVSLGIGYTRQVQQQAQSTHFKTHHRHYLLHSYLDLIYAPVMQVEGTFNVDDAPFYDITPYADLNRFGFRLGSDWKIARSDKRFTPSCRLECGVFPGLKQDTQLYLQLRIGLQWQRFKTLQNPPTNV